jgi:apolipoprotein N-acyltransferase
VPSRLLWLLLAVAGGIVWGLSFGKVALGLGAWLTLAPLPLLLGHRRAGTLAFLHGLAAWETSLYWIVPTLRHYGSLSWPLAVVLTSVLAAYLALFHAAFGWLGGPIWRRFGSGSRVGLALLALPALWVALEWLRTYFLGGFPWNLAAYAWIGVPGALPLSAWIGAYGISFLVVLVAVGIALMIKNGPWLPGSVVDPEASSSVSSSLRRRSDRPPHPPDPLPTPPGGQGAPPPTRSSARSLVSAARGGVAGRSHPATPAICALVVPLLLLPLAGRWSLRRSAAERQRAAEAGILVQLLQPDVANQVGWDPRQALADYRKVAAMSFAACRPGVLVVWPESAGWPFEYRRDAILDRDLAAMVGQGCGVLFNTDSPAPDGEHAYNSAYLLAPGAPPLRYDKRHLVPFGEYVPFERVLFFAKTVARNIGQFQPAARLALLPWRGELLGPAICYEVVFPEETAALTRAGATILVTITNDGWYGDTAAPWQHLRAARFRAAENRRPMLRAAITGVSAVIAPDGSVLGELGVGEEGVLRALVAGERQLTPYARRPWLPPLAATALAAAAAVYTFRSSSRRRVPAARDEVE